MDQTELGNRMAVVRGCVRVGDRSLPLAWQTEAGAANSGFAGQQIVLERVQAWLPAGVEVLLSADRFYPSAALFAWLQAQGWRYRRRLKGNLLVDTGYEAETTPGALVPGVSERICPGSSGSPLGCRQTWGYGMRRAMREPWIIAMDCLPTRAAVRDDGARWAIEPTFADFKSRGFALAASPRDHADRLERLILIMALARYGCVRVGRDDAVQRPTVLEKKLKRRPTPTLGASENATAARCLGSHEGGGA